MQAIFHMDASIRAWLNGNTMFYETFVCFYVIEAKPNLFVSVFVHKCLMVLNDVEYTTFKMFVTQMSNYLFVISFQLMFYKTLRCSLARPLDAIPDDWKILLKGNGEHTTNDSNSSTSYHKVWINNRSGYVNKLTSKKICRHLIQKISAQPIAQKQ